MSSATTINVAIRDMDPGLASRVRIAMDLQAARGQVVRSRQPGDSDLDVVIVDFDSLDGKVAAMEQVALGRDVIGLTESGEGFEDGVALLPRRLPIREMHRHLGRIMDARGHKASGREQVSGQALLKLCRDASLSRAKVVECRWDAGRVILRRDASRVLAPGFGFLAEAAEGLLDPGRSLEALGREGLRVPDSWVSGSLDGFLVRAVRRPGLDLPRLRGNAFRLSGWPDLGDLTDPLALRVATFLNNQAASMEHLASRCEVREARINNLLWAFRAAGLLIRETAPEVGSAPARRQTGGVLGRLADRLGLTGVSRAG